MLYALIAPVVGLIVFGLFFWGIGRTKLSPLAKNTARVALTVLAIAFAIAYFMNLSH